ncbi:MAG: aminotransferase class I/II-fold pyridoxal phosphate-dependent enzyme [Coleofasciculaceae cyanobacterium RL_1_1]|nr:aminotransferase class I/II-fold pyridoxal phosphate-dependent enzyme [Coleofasciculaceae cyanobacterium RL_1_1]
MAGLRLGFGVANPRLLSEIAKVKPVYNIGAITARVGAAAISDRAYKDARSAMIRQTRSRFTQALHDRGFTVWPSSGNFVLLRPPGYSARSLHEALRSRQIWTRYYPQPDLADKLRITIGTDAQMQQVIAAIEAINI